ncbi:MAG: M14 family metallopeptidase, partial [Anaerolineae bacterium]
MYPSLRRRAAGWFLLLVVWIALALEPYSSLADNGTHPQALIVRIAAGTPQLRTQLFHLGIDVLAVDLQGITARLTPAQLRTLERAGFLCQVLTAETQSIIVDDRYHTFAETEAELQAVAAQHPDIARLEVIGRSVEGRPIYALKISDHAQEEEWSEPAVLIFALTHAREHLSTEMALDIIHMLIEGYGQSGEITNLVHQREIWIIPDLNPDGDVYDVESGYYRFWRKNRRPNPDGSFGVDLNRNFAYQWGCCGGSSSDPADEIYRGSAPFSEPESAALGGFAASHPNITISLNLHSYGELVLWPYGYTYESLPADMRPQDYEAFRRLAGAAADLNGYRAMQASQLYLADGAADDWLY